MLGVGVQFFLLLDPAILHFLTAGVLMPAVHLEQIHFSGFDCALGEGGSMGPATGNATLGAMSAQITQALHSDPEDDRSLRGSLVFALLEEGHHPASMWGEPALRHFPLHGVSGQRAERWSNERMAGFVRCSIGLCLAVGLLFGGMCTYALATSVRKLRHDSWMTEEADIKCLFEQRYRSEADKYFLAARAEGGEARAKPSGNPFDEPLKTLTIMVVQPLRQRYVDSLANFVRASLHRRDAPDGSRVSPEGANVEGDRPRSEPFIYMTDLVRHYEVYCLEQKLLGESSRNAIQRRLVAEFGARVRIVQADRLYGLKWSDRIGKMTATKPHLPGLHSMRAQEVTAILVRAFVDACCLLDPDEWLDLQTRPGPDGFDDLGFVDALAEWCQMNQLPTPTKFDWDSPQWCTRALPAAVTVRLSMTARQVRGLEYKQSVREEEETLGVSFYCSMTTP